MNEEIESLVNAIESLQQESNPFKDYIFPLVAGFFSALLGALVAYFTLRYQDRIQLEKERVYTVNDWLLLAIGAMQSLVAIKNNYHGKLSNNPIRRALVTDVIIHSPKKLDKNISSLSFIIPKNDDMEAKAIKWRQLPRITTMIENYNLVIETWNKRNEKYRPLKEKILKDHSNLAYADVSREQILQSGGSLDVSVLIDFTETAIKLTDDLIIELNDFLAEFPEIGKSLINKKCLEQYGHIVTYEVEDNPELLALIDKVPEVDYTILAELFGETVEAVKNRYATGY